MASKKYRKKVRTKSILCAHETNAARMFFNKESDELYYKEISAINSDMSDTEIMMRQSHANLHFFGSAYMNLLMWSIGGIKLQFSVSPKGNIHAKNITVNRI